MRPIELTMEAFGSYGNKTTIDFSKLVQNIFLITGDTGAGKTTIFDAIVFALYGEASSNLNKKDGIVLQSQYIGYEKVPKVQLTFSSGMSEEALTYTVTRIPKHKQALKRASSKGNLTKDVSESVELAMPDGSILSRKEADEKLIEIIGLTKAQFMQVAMIAQGEFMEILREKTDEKKVIFRKLFRTELYDGIAKELGERKRAKEQELNQIKTMCTMEVARVCVPNAYDRQSEYMDCEKQIKEGKLTILDSYIDELACLCKYTKNDKKAAGENLSKKQELANSYREEFAAATGLLKFFEQLEEANKKLSECAEKEKMIQQLTDKKANLKYALEVKQEYEKVLILQKQVLECERKRNDELEKKPDLERSVKEKEEGEAISKETLNAENARLHVIQEKVKKALELLEQRDVAEKELQEVSQKHQSTKRKLNHNTEEAQKLKSQLQECNRTIEKLNNSEIELERCKNSYEELKQLRQDFEEFAENNKVLEEKKKDYQTLQKEYQVSRKNYLDKKAQYDDSYLYFLDEQAGILAANLKVGEPCPVCGSLEHPEPCHFTHNKQSLSKEQLAELKKEVDSLQERQEQLAGKTGEKLASIKILEEQLLLEQEKLTQKLYSYQNTDDGKDISLGDAIQKLLSQAKEQLRICNDQVLMWNKQKDALQKIKIQIDDCENEKSRLVVLESEQNAAVEGKKSTFASFENSLEYQTKEEANRILGESILTQKKANEDYERKKAIADEKRNNLAKSKALIEQYEKDIPEFQNRLQEQKQSYRKLMNLHFQTEDQWQLFTNQYDAQTLEAWEKKITDYNAVKFHASQQHKDSQRAIEGKNKPDKEELQIKLNEEQEQVEELQKEYESASHRDQLNQDVLKNLKKQLENRKEIIAMHARVDNLYRMVSGNMTGARMDLETFVQRYYLKRILSAANIRFREMSAGQFELRMVDIQKAAEGKNRGLDLMVYSTVTGKEREIRTLSGGESFMAALSIALGMADQIQMDSAAVNLDIMFIDEGFGSLDEHSRNQAVKVLKQMADGTRLIGIISHVTELKQEIDNQLIVSKTENGSKVHWEFG